MTHILYVLDVSVPVPVAQRTVLASPGVSGVIPTGSSQTEAVYTFPAL